MVDVHVGHHAPVRCGRRRWWNRRRMTDNGSIFTVQAMRTSHQRPNVRLQLILGLIAFGGYLSSYLEIWTLLRNRTYSTRGTASEFVHEQYKVEQIQQSHATSKNRYKEMFAALKLASNMKAGHTILSFGCSTGEEAFTLAETYFPGSDNTIYGADTDTSVLRTASINAESLNVTAHLIFFNPISVAIDRYGPYDIILANSVLCRHPPPATVLHLMEMFPFEEFERVLSVLDSSLKIGGLLTVFNTNYDFLESSLSVRYESLGEICPSHLVPRIDRSQLKLVDMSKLQVDCIFRKLH